MSWNREAIASNFFLFFLHFGFGDMNPEEHNYEWLLKIDESLAIN